MDINGRWCTPCDFLKRHLGEMGFFSRRELLGSATTASKARFMGHTKHARINLKRKREYCCRHLHEKIADAIDQSHNQLRRCCRSSMSTSLL